VERAGRLGPVAGSAGAGFRVSRPRGWGKTPGDERSAGCSGGGGVGGGDEAGRRRGSAGLEDAREGLFGALGGGAGEALGPGEGSGVSHLLRKTPIGVPIRYGFVE